MRLGIEFLDGRRYRNAYYYYDYYYIDNEGRGN